MAKTIQTFLTAAGAWMARPAAFAFVIAYVVLWLIFDMQSFNFHGAIALITLCMTLFIQRSEHRDTQAIQAKLDELLRTQGDARRDLTKIDDQQPEQIEAHRDRARSTDQAAGHPTSKP
jgi:low affinity Fe/Cu permease